MQIGFLMNGRTHCTTWITVLGLAAFLSGCDSLVQPRADGPPMLTLDIRSAGAIPGEPILLMGWLDARSDPPPRYVQVHSSAGDSKTVTMDAYQWRGENEGFGAPWINMSDPMLAAFIGGYGTPGSGTEWQASLGIIEDDAVRQPAGLPPTAETTDETIERVMDWLRAEGVTEIERQPGPLAYLTIRIPRSVSLVGLIRGHPNVETVEPSGMVIRSDDDPWPDDAGDIYGVIETTTGSGPGLHVQPGDVITVSYRRPDGRVLEDSIVIVDPD